MDVFAGKEQITFRATSKLAILSIDLFIIYGFILFTNVLDDECVCVDYKYWELQLVVTSSSNSRIAYLW